MFSLWNQFLTLFLALFFRFLSVWLSNFLFRSNILGVISDAVYVYYFQLLMLWICKNILKKTCSHAFKANLPPDFSLILYGENIDVLLVANLVSTSILSLKIFLNKFFLTKACNYFMENIFKKLYEISFCLKICSSTKYTNKIKSFILISGNIHFIMIIGKPFLFMDRNR